MYELRTFLPRVFEGFILTQNIYDEPGKENQMHNMSTIF